MIYFKTVALNLGEKDLLEKALRRVALKRAKSLDFERTVYDTGADKLFLGLESTKDVRFTRLRTSLEQFFPKIIISFPKDETSNEYKFRLGVLATLIFVLTAIGFIAGIALAVMDNDYDDIVDSLVPVGVFTLLTFLELKIVNSRINKAVARYKQEAS